MPHPFDELVQIMQTLRSDEGCPWDREQDHQSLKRYLIEEAYETLEAIDEGDDTNLADELGDVLLQVVFHSCIAAETNRFDVYDVIDNLKRKLIRRHPHVFGDAEAADVDAVLQTWEAIKRAEAAKENKEAASADDDPPSKMAGIPRALPALARCAKVQKRAAEVGFDWEDGAGPLEKVAEEVREVQQSGSEEEWGDLFFSLVNAARHAGIDAEEAARQAALKFERRFRGMERQAHAAGLPLQNMTLSQQNALWDEEKRLEDDREDR